MDCSSTAGHVDDDLVPLSVWRRRVYWWWTAGAGRRPTGEVVAERLQGAIVLDDRSAEIAMLALQAAALDLVQLPDLGPFGFTDADVCGVRALSPAPAIHGEPGVELVVVAEGPGELWDALVDAGAVPAGWARATPAARGRATRCTATTWTSSAPRSRRASAGSARWTQGLLGRRRAACPARRRPDDRLVALRVEGRGIPRPGMRCSRPAQVTSGTMSPSLGVGIGMAYVPVAGRSRARTRDRRPRPAGSRARWPAKPLYVKESAS